MFASQFYSTGFQFVLQIVQRKNFPEMYILSWSGVIVWVSVVQRRTVYNDID